MEEYYYFHAGLKGIELELYALEYGLERFENEADCDLEKRIYAEYEKKYERILYKNAFDSADLGKMREIELRKERE